MEEAEVRNLCSYEQRLMCYRRELINSIEDSREFVPDLNEAVPKGFNINPTGKHLDYKLSLSHHLDVLERAILRNEIHCVVWVLTFYRLAVGRYEAPINLTGNYI